MLLSGNKIRDDEDELAERRADRRGLEDREVIRSGSLSMYFSFKRRTALGEASTGARSVLKKEPW
jgi:hypothetical protein